MTLTGQRCVSLTSNPFMQVDVACARQAAQSDFQLGAKWVISTFWKTERTEGGGAIALARF